jgi:hypothetical protein
MSELRLLQDRGILPATAPVGTDNPPRNPVWVRDPPKRLAVVREKLFLLRRVGTFAISRVETRGEKSS